MNTNIKPLGISEDEMREIEKVEGPWKKNVKKMHLDMYLYPKPDEDDITALEAKFGKLPLEYRNFLMKHNGGIPDKNVVVTKDNERVVNLFFPVKYPKHYPDGLYIYIEIYDGRVPVGMLPIGSGGGGDLLLIQLSEENYGKIYYWDHELESDTDALNFYENIELVADSFNDFLNLLREGS